MAITAKELAAQLGISAAAVSMALNNKPGVSTATRKKVIAAAKESGFDFSRLHLTEENNSTPTGTITFAIYRKSGAVVTDTPFFSRLIEGINEGCRLQHYFMNVQYVSEEDDISALLEDWQRAGSVGIILLGTEMTDVDFTPFANTHLPIVLLDNDLEERQLDCVQINNIHGAFMATQYLIQRTHKTPGYLKSSYPIHNFDERSDGFYKALRRNGISTHKAIVHELTPSIEGAYADMREIIASKEELAEAYFADNDLIAAGVIRALRDTGHRVPDEIAVIGFDNMPVASYMEPQLTTINVPKEYMGQMAVNRLCQIISEKGNQKTSPVKIEISTKLVKRKSV